MDIAALAAATVALLGPYLAEAGTAAAKKTGEAIVSLSPKVYQAVKAKFAQKPAALETLTDLERNPSDADLQAAVRVQLRKLLAEDPSFAHQLQDLLEQAPPSQTTTSVEVVGDGTAVAGDDNIVVGQKGIYVGGDVQGSITEDDA